MNKKIHEITIDEWSQFDWIQVLQNTPNYFIRGIKKTQPPNDGYKYIEITTYADSEQKWARAYELLP